MKENNRKRVAARVMVTACLAAALALIPPVAYHNPLYGVFFLEDAAKDIARRFSDATRWIHMGGIVAVWLLNLVFFVINEARADSGRTLARRISLQNVLNFLFLVLCVAAMIGYRYSLSSLVWIGILLPTATQSVATLWMPYYIVAICALILWKFCMNAAPATNVIVRNPIARWIDVPAKRADRNR